MTGTLVGQRESVLGIGASDCDRSESNVAPFGHSRPRSGKPGSGL